MYMRAVERAITGKSDFDLSVLHEDNKGALKWAQDPANHKKTRHIDTAYHSIREQVAEFKNLIVKFVVSAANIGDAFTKPLPMPQFKKLLKNSYGSGIL